MTVQSMTGFATLAGHLNGFEWVWEIRSVNGRGLDLRLRMPEGLEILEPKVRAEIPKFLRRGAVNITLKLSRADTGSGVSLNPAVLSQMISASIQVNEEARIAGLRLTQSSVAEIISLRGVLDSSRKSENLDEIAKAVFAQLSTLLEALIAARKAEGKALDTVLNAQTRKIEGLIAQARKTDGARMAQTGETLRSRVKALIDATEIVDESRLAQELALLAVKADITEEIDRLDAHVASANALLKENGPVGRKLDFLMQEFNREANTLCSKSGDAALTAVGLELKVTIDQMREQVQNVE